MKLFSITFPTTICVLLLCRSLCEVVEWDYGNGDEGPDNWGKLYPICEDGVNQSPLQISFDNLLIFDYSDSNKEMLNFKDYEKPIIDAVVRNTGYSIEIDVTQPIVMTAHFLTAKYRLQYITFHWALNGGEGGSEHTLGYARYPLEVQFVHYNENVEKSKVFDNEYGVAIVSVFYEVIDRADYIPHEKTLRNEQSMNLITKSFSLLEFNKPKKLPNSFNISHLFPRDHESVIHYRGSMTRPPCAEVVDWLILTSPAQMTEDHLQAFQNVYLNYSNTEIGSSGNFRDTQKLGKRKLELRVPKVNRIRVNGANRWTHSVNHYHWIIAFYVSKLLF